MDSGSLVIRLVMPSAAWEMEIRSRTAFFIVVGVMPWALL